MRGTMPKRRRRVGSRKTQSFCSEFVGTSLRFSPPCGNDKRAARDGVSLVLAPAYLPGVREVLAGAVFVGTVLFGRDPSSAESRATRMRIMMSAPSTNTTVKEPNATRAASRLFAALAAAAFGATPESDGGSTGSPPGAACGAANGGIPAAGTTGDGRERLGFVAERGIPDAALRSMMTVPWSAMSLSSSSSGCVMERALTRVGR